MLDTNRWVREVYYELLIEYADYEDDKYILMSINASIGWANCLEKYDIEPDAEDLREMQEYYALILTEMRIVDDYEYLWMGGEDDED